jgi:hypothetical protein
MCHEVDVFAPDRGEHAVVRVNAGVEGRYLHSRRAPLVCSDHAQQFGERDRHRLGRRTVRLGACLAHVGGSAQVQAVVVFQQDEEPAQHAGAVAS